MSTDKAKTGRKKKCKNEEERLREAASAALDRAVDALSEIGYTELESKRTYRTEKNDPELGKVTTVEEEKEIRLVKSSIDVSALKQITATLKDIKDVLGVAPSADGGETGVIFLPQPPEPNMGTVPDL